MDILLTYTDGTTKHLTVEDGSHKLYNHKVRGWMRACLVEISNGSPTIELLDWFHRCLNHTHYKVFVDGKQVMDYEYS